MRTVTLPNGDRAVLADKLRDLQNEIDLRLGDMDPRDLIALAEIKEAQAQQLRLLAAEGFERMEVECL